jgi:hypothetical protein
MVIAASGVFEQDRALDPNEGLVALESIQMPAATTNATVAVPCRGE